MRCLRPTELALLASFCCGASACDSHADKLNHTRSEAVSSASQEMSGPSLLSRERLLPALAALREKAGGKLLRLELKPSELVAQAADPNSQGAVIELHYREGKVSEPEPAALRGKGQLADNLFDWSDVKLDTVPELAREAVRRVDSESGHVELVLVRRNLPDSEDVRFRVYVASPRRSGYLDADKSGQAL